jgi:VCBS repeat-containing protein
VITGGPDTASLTETDTTLTATGTMTVTDIDLSDTVTMSVDSVVVDGSSTFGGTNPLTKAQLKAMLSVTGGALAADPSAGTDFDWTFTSGASGNAAFNFLGAGETLVLRYTIKATDSSGVPTGVDTETVTITITGTNDAPVITGGPDTASLTETDTTLTATGTMTVTDIDLSDTVTMSVDSVVVDGSSTFGGTNPLTKAQLKAMLSVTGGALAADPSAGTDFDWTFTSGASGNAAFNFLGAGETLVLRYTIKATDSSGVPTGVDTETVTITITGTNDAPVITGSVSRTS